MTENINDGIVKTTINGIEYNFWIHAKVVRRYVRDDLKKRFPGKIIAREMNSIDYTIPELNLPVEIQATRAYNLGIHYSGWENEIRKQIEQNIINSGRCLFYFDSELLKAMRNAKKNISINMDWFRTYIKEKKLEVFVINHNGIIESKGYKDFDFIANMSQTCSIASETDDMILNKNKMKVYSNVANGYGFTSEDVEKIENCYEKLSNKEDVDNFRSFLLKNSNERIKLYGQILHALDDLSKINKILCRNIDIRTFKDFRKHTAKVLGIFDTSGKGSYVITRFVDRFDICKHFPGYLRNKEIWGKSRRFSLNARQFENIVTGKTDVIRSFDLQKEIEDSWLSKN